MWQRLLPRLQRIYLLFKKDCPRSAPLTSDRPTSPYRLRLGDLPERHPTPFEIIPDTAALESIAAHLELLGLRKLRFIGTLAPSGRADWELKADLGATVVQPCGITLAPVQTRIDTKVARNYLADFPEAPEGEEIEMPADVDAEPLPRIVDLEAVMIEALSLALPAWPRAEGVHLEETVVTEPGAAPLTAEAARPFAGLAALRDKLGNSEDNS